MNPSGFFFPDLDGRDDDERREYLDPEDYRDADQCRKCGEDCTVCRCDPWRYERRTA